ncbi:MAG: TrbI/VirB10 family protein [Alphaproteobacteria bacterium]
MTDNFEQHEPNDQFTEPEVGLSESSPSKGMAGNLAEAWRTRPLFKFMVIIIATFAVGVAVVNFLGGGQKEETAHINRPPNLKVAPGGDSSPAFRDQIKMADEERAKQAIASGGSAFNTPFREKTDNGAFNNEDKKPDPMIELRAEVDRLQKQTQQTQMQQVQMQQHPEPFDGALAEAMQRQMKQLLESWNPKGIVNVTVIRPEDMKAAENTNGAAGAAGTTPPTQPSKIIVNAGTVSYAQLLVEANSDVPGPILAQIVSGPLSGARAVGSFQVADGYEKYLVLKFTLADKKGKDYKIEAIALDPDTTLGGMATEVDERYFARVVLPAAAGFLQGMGQALGQGNTTMTTNGTLTLTTTTQNGFRQGVYNGLGQGAQTAGQFFQNQANLTKPLVRVAAGTPMGLFFVSPVLEPNENGAPTAQVPANGPNGNPTYGNNNGYNNNNGNPYPGTTVNGFGGGAQNNGAPYPNYSTPGYGYGNNTRYPGMYPGMNGQYLPPAQNYGQ